VEKFRRIQYISYILFKSG